MLLVAIVASRCPWEKREKREGGGKEKEGGNPGREVAEGPPIGCRVV